MTVQVSNKYTRKESQRHRTIWHWSESSYL